MVSRVCLLRAETERGLSRKHIIEGSSMATLRQTDTLHSLVGSFVKVLNVGCVFVCVRAERFLAEDAAGVRRRGVCQPAGQQHSNGG